ncbi:MAG: hypothetical protein ACI4UM_02080 [Succinivibrio sp.]
MTLEQYTNQKNALIEEWKKRISNYSFFVSDGVVNPNNWFSQEKRLLFLLKEAYSDSSDKTNWDLGDDYLAKYALSQPLWRTVSQLSEGLFESDKDLIYPYCKLNFSDERQKELFNKICVVNIKKADGKRSSDSKEIDMIAKEQSDLLFRQIKLCDPTIIVCGGTFSALNTIIKNQDVSVPNTFDNKNTGRSRAGKWYYYIELNGHKVLVLDYYHPSYHITYLIKYYGLMGIYHMALNDSQE